MKKLNKVLKLMPLKKIKLRIIFKLEKMKELI